MVEILRGVTRGQVTDRTGLAGNYDIVLTYAPESLSALVSPNRPFQSLPSIFTALEEQLGLKLEPEQVAVEYVVIDHAEWPRID